MTEGDRRMDWKTLLACITGSVEEQLLLRNEYVVEENRILRNQIAGRVQLTDAERQTLAAIGKKLGKQALEEVATIVKPDTILAWHRKPTVCLGATYVVAYTYGYDGGRISPTHCAIIDVALGDRSRQRRACSRPPAGAGSARIGLVAGNWLRDLGTAKCSQVDQR